jgi:recombination protein RecT
MAETTKPGQELAIVVDVQRMESQFELALPEHVSPKRFVRTVVTALRKDSRLAKASRESVLSACLKCATDGLMPDGHEAALVVYNGVAQYLPMIAGILKKVRQSGDLLTISAHVVYDKDMWRYVLGDEERIEHEPFMDGPRGRPVAVYAVAKTRDGGIYREVMSVQEVEEVRAVSKAKNDGPWVTWWGEMAKKTVMRRMSKRLPMSTDLERLFARDNDHYDLAKAKNQPRLRKLHADFDEPEEPAPKPEAVIPPPDGEPPADAEFEDEGPALGQGEPVANADGPQPVRAAASPETPAGAALSASDGGTAMDHGSSATGGDTGLGRTAEDDDDPIGWAVAFNRQLEACTTTKEIDALIADKRNIAGYEALAAQRPAMAKEINSAIKTKGDEVHRAERARS